MTYSIHTQVLGVADFDGVIDNLAPKHIVTNEKNRIDIWVYSVNSAEIKLTLPKY